MEYLHGKAYPTIEDVRAVRRPLTAEPQSFNALATKLYLNADTVENALDKLWIHGGAVIQGDEVVKGPNRSWAASYEEQKRHKLAMLDGMFRFADGAGCRMERLVHHFGDLSDSAGACRICDQCAPSAAITQTFRQPDRDELEVMDRILEGLVGGRQIATGKYFQEISLVTGTERRHYEAVIGALARAGMVTIRKASFTKGGRQIDFQKISLSAEGEVQAGRALDPQTIKTVLADDDFSAGPSRAKSKSGKAAKKATLRPTPTLSAADRTLLGKLSQWRKDTAKKSRIPAFKILSNATLEELAATRPSSQEQLLAVKGIGEKKAARFGNELLRMVGASS